MVESGMAKASPDAHALDVQALRKTLLDAAAAAAGRDRSEITARARARAQSSGFAGALRLADALEDPDWRLPPSARRRIAGALTYFGDPDCVPEASRSVEADVLVEQVAADLEAELKTWEAFRSYRERLDRGRSGAETRERKLEARKRRLRARLQAQR
jgi:hypothetical protein